MKAEEWKADFTGFISCREFGVPLMLDLERALKWKHFVAHCWGALKKDTVEHRTEAGNNIRASAFSIVIADAEGIGRPGKEGISAFHAELNAIRARIDNAEASGRPYLWRVIIAQNESGAPSFSDLDAIFPPEFSWLAGNVYGRGLRCVDGHFDYDESKKIAVEIDTWFADNRATLLKGRRPPGKLSEGGQRDKKDKASPAPDLATKEEDYLDRSMPTWVDLIVAKGRHGGPLDFHLSRAIPLRGADASGFQASLSNWLFDPAAKPLVLRGGPGSGKRCAMLAAAATLARRWHKRFEPYFTSPAAQVFLKDAETLDKKQYMPMVLQAERVAHFAHGKVITAEHVHAAIASELLRTPKPTHQECSQIADRLAERPYALFIDGAEALRDNSPRELMSALLQINVATGGALKAVVTARAGIPRSNAQEIELLRLTDAQVMTFMAHFADDQCPGQKTKRDQAEAKLLRARETLLANATDPVSGTAANEVLGTPLLLSAFCWATLNSLHGFSERRTLLSAQLLDHILADELRVPDGPTLTADDVRKLLQLLALRSPDTAFTLGRAMLATSAWRSRRTDMNSEDAFYDVLRCLSEQTSLLVELESASDRQFKFCTTFWPEHLAAEALADDPRLLQGTLFEMDAAKVAAQSRVFTNACARLLNSASADRFERALDIPSAALGRADDATLPCEDVANLVGAALEALAIAAPRIAREGDAEAQARAAAACEAAAATYRAAHGAWTLQQRDVCLNELARTARRQDPWDTALATRSLLDRALGGEPWIEFATKAGPVTIASRPVIAAEFDAFLRVLDGDMSAPEIARLFDHAGNEDEAARLDQLTGSDARDMLAALRSRPASPVLYLTWYEAVAFCRWLTERLRKAEGNVRIGADELVRLPTNQECKAVFVALAGEGNYPWGDDMPPLEGDGARINWRSSGLGRATVPGVFPPELGPGNLPLWDFASNVRIWTTPSASKGQRWWPQSPDEEAGAVVFGGSWAAPHSDSTEDAGPTFQALKTRTRQIGLRLVKVRVE